MEKQVRYTGNKHSHKKFNTNTKNSIVKYFKCSGEVNELLLKFSDDNAMTQSLIIQRALLDYFTNLNLKDQEKQDKEANK